jgi:hypothetical protein
MRKRCVTTNTAPVSVCPELEISPRSYVALFSEIFDSIPTHSLNSTTSTRDQPPCASGSSRPTRVPTRKSSVRRPARTRSRLGIRFLKMGMVVSRAPTPRSHLSCHRLGATRHHLHTTRPHPRRSETCPRHYSWEARPQHHLLRPMYRAPRLPANPHPSVHPQATHRPPPANQPPFHPPPPPNQSLSNPISAPTTSRATSRSPSNRVSSATCCPSGSSWRSAG